MRVRHPIDWRNEKFRDLGDKDETHQNTEENHLRPTTTNTSSSFVKSTAGVSCACPSNSRTRNSLTAPIKRPGGNTPPLPRYKLSGQAANSPVSTENLNSTMAQ